MDWTARFLDLASSRSEAARLSSIDCLAFETSSGRVSRAFFKYTLEGCPSASYWYSMRTTPAASRTFSGRLFLSKSVTVWSALVWVSSATEEEYSCAATKPASKTASLAAEYQLESAEGTVTLSFSLKGMVLYPGKPPSSTWPSSAKVCE